MLSLAFSPTNVSPSAGERIVTCGGVVSETQTSIELSNSTPVIESSTVARRWEFRAASGQPRPHAITSDRVLTGGADRIVPVRFLALRSLRTYRVLRRCMRPGSRCCHMSVTTPLHSTNQPRKRQFAPALRKSNGSPPLISRGVPSGKMKVDRCANENFDAKAL